MSNDAPGTSNRKYNNIEKPWKHNEWLIWPKTILNNIDMSDCNDTIEGVCYENKTLEECMKHCPYDECGMGVYVKFKNGESICAPIKTSGHPNLSPIYRLKRQQIYDLDPADVHTSVFINTKLFPFPPNLANTVFFGDIFELVSIDGKLKLHTSVVNSTDKQIRSSVIMVKDGSSKCKLLPSVKSANHAIHDIPVVYGDSFEINAANTSYVAGISGKKPHMLLKWKDALGIFEGKGLTFEFIPTGSNKGEGDLVTYSDEVILKYSYGSDSGIVEINDDKNNLHIVDDTATITDKMKFKLTSLMEGYYCDDGQCKSVPINKITPAQYPGTWDMKPPDTVLSSGTYKGNTVFFNPGCWNTCGYVKPGAKDDGTLSLVNNHFSPFSTSPPPDDFNKKSSLFVVISVISIVLTILMIIGIVIYIRKR